MRFALIALTSLIFTFEAPAQAPSLVNYQGLLTDVNGNVITGSRNFSVAIFDAATQGTQLYTENIGSVTLESGVYSFQFGSGNGFVNALSSGNQHWLEISVNSVVQSPRQRLVSVPFALQAAEVRDGSVTSTKLAVGVAPKFDRQFRYVNSSPGGNLADVPGLTLTTKDLGAIGVYKIDFHATATNTAGAYINVNGADIPSSYAVVQQAGVNGLWMRITSSIIVSDVAAGTIIKVRAFGGALNNAQLSIDGVLKSQTLP